MALHPSAASLQAGLCMPLYNVLTACQANPPSHTPAGTCRRHPAGLGNSHRRPLPVAFVRKEFAKHSIVHHAPAVCGQARKGLSVGPQQRSRHAACTGRRRRMAGRQARAKPQSLQHRRCKPGMRKARQKAGPHPASQPCQAARSWPPTPRPRPAAPHQALPQLCLRWRCRCVWTRWAARLRLQQPCPQPHCPCRRRRLGSPPEGSNTGRGTG